MSKGFQILLGAILILVLIALGYFIRISFEIPPAIPLAEIIQGDTVRVIEKYYYQTHEITEAEVKNDTAKTISKINKVFGLDTLNLETNISYSIPDSNFDIDYKFDFIQTREIITDTMKIPYPVIKEKDVPFYEQPWLDFALGIITAITIFLLAGGR